MGNWKMTNVDKAIEMFPTLLDLTLRKEDDKVEMKTITGKSINFKLLQIPEVTVLNALLLDNLEFPWHVHDVAESIHVYAGEVEFENKAGERRVGNPEKPVYFKAGMPHRVIRATENAKAIVILIPSEEAFDAGQ